MKPGYSRDTIAANIEAAQVKGATRKAAAFDALCAARASYFKRFPNGALPRSLAMPKDRLLRDHYTADGKPLFEIATKRNRGPASRRDVSYREHPANA